MVRDILTIDNSSGRLTRVDVATVDGMVVDDSPGLDMPYVDLYLRGGQTLHLVVKREHVPVIEKALGFTR